MKKIISLLICIITICFVFTSCAEEQIPTIVIENYTSTATAKPQNGEAKFIVKASNDGMYDFTLEKKDAEEWNFKFCILNEENVNVTGEIYIHSTEWVSRSVFLQKGDYTLVVFGDEVDKDIVLSIDVVNYFEDNEAVLTQTEEITAPVTLAFNALNREEKEVKISLDGNQSTLSFSAFGTGDYYEYEQQFNLRIVDEQGEEVFASFDMAVEENVYEGTYKVDVTGFKGEYTAFISAYDTCTVAIYID